MDAWVYLLVTPVGVDVVMAVMSVAGTKSVPLGMAEPVNGGAGGKLLIMIEDIVKLLPIWRQPHNERTY